MVCGKADQDLTISLVLRCAFMLFGYRTSLQFSGLTCNPTQREILSSKGSSWKTGWVGTTVSSRRSHVGEDYYMIVRSQEEGQSLGEGSSPQVTVY